MKSNLGVMCSQIDIKKLEEAWKKEEKSARIIGWDFSHIDGRYTQLDLPWDYKNIVEHYINDDMSILDYDTGGGEFLLSLNHPYSKTSATEGYKPNVELCSNKLKPLGIDFKECNNPSKIPFENEKFDAIINRHGSFDANELYRLLKKDGLFITQQVGEDNDRELVEMVIPNAKKTFSHLNLSEQIKVFEEAGFSIVESAEAFCPIRFYDVGAFVWFARIIEWEFPGFSVDNCLDSLIKMQKTIDQKGYVEGTVHRYLIVAKK